MKTLACEQAAERESELKEIFGKQKRAERVLGEENEAGRASGQSFDDADF